MKQLLSLAAVLSLFLACSGQAGIAVEVVSRPNLYLLCVGVSRYRNTGYNLQFPSKDAEAVAAVMKGQAGKLFGRVNSVVLSDSEVTVPRIKAELAKLKAAKTGDTVMVFLSGHGISSQGKFYFACHNVDLQKVEQTCLPWQEVTRSLSGVQGTKLLFADACHSGMNAADRQAASRELAAGAEAAGIVMLASSQGAEFSFEEQKLGHGAFTVALLEALRGKGDLYGDGTTTVLGIAIYVAHRVNELTRGLQHPQLVSIEDFDPLTPLLSKDATPRRPPPPLLNTR